TAMTATMLCVISSANLSCEPVLLLSAQPDASGSGLGCDLLAAEFGSALAASLDVAEQFAGQVPGFGDLPLADQSALIVCHGLDVVVARAAYRATQLSDQEFVLDSGYPLLPWKLSSLRLLDWLESLRGLSSLMATVIRDDKQAFGGLAASLLLFFNPQE
uniref:Glyco_tran_28_C domain-containing protein n=2 Tax=Macrostomum lignano TaxID=282301 RepID=A0A1I8IB34_9PLAT